MFFDYSALSDDSVVCGVGTNAKVVGKGTIKLRFNLGSGKSIVHTLTNVLHIPSAPSCLLSIPKFTESLNGNVQFGKGIVRLHKSNGTLIGTGHKINGLYLLKANTVYQPEQALPAASSKPSWDTWHLRFGHMGISGLKHMFKKKMASGFDVDTTAPNFTECPTCVASKMTCQSFPIENESRAKHVGEKTHSDIWGPYCTALLQGSQYFIFFIDNNSQHIKLNFLKLKSEAKLKIKEYILWLRNHTKKPAKYLKVDHGTEYLQKDVQAFLKGEGMGFQVTAPYAHQQHGTAERAN